MFKYAITVCMLIGLNLLTSLANPLGLSEEELSTLRKQKEVLWSSGKFEGDMVLRPGLRNGMVSTFLRWPNNVVPYLVDPIFSANEKRLIDMAVKEFAERTCVTVRPKVATDVDYVHVTGHSQGCFSSVGRQRGDQQLNLQVNGGCLWYHIIIHEFLHAIGFQHQQSTWNRDDYIDIFLQNVPPHLWYNFDKYQATDVTNYGYPYDYGSIMHYNEFASSINGLPTLRPKDPAWIGRVGLAPLMSEIDAAKVNAMYNCPK